MKLNLRISFNDGRVIDPVEVILADMIKFEQKFEIPVSNLTSSQKLTHIVFLAWAAATRLKLTTLDFDAFTESVSEVGASDISPK